MEQINNKQPGIIRYAVTITKRPAFCVFVFFCTFYYFTNAGWYKGGDEHFMSEVARQIVKKGQIGFNLDKPPREEDCVRGPSGLYYYKWGLGQSLVEVPFYFIHHLIWRPPSSSNVHVSHRNAYVISELILLFLCPSIISALGCVLMLWFGLRLGFSKRVSVFLSLVYGLGTMVWPYSKSLMSDTTLNVAVLGSVYAAVSYVSTRHSRWLAVSGACMGFAIVTKVISVVIVPFLVVYILFTIRSWRAVRDLCICFGPPLIALLGIQFWHNVIRYGSLWQFGYHGGRGILGFCTPLYVGLWGLFASPGKSFFLYTPVAILGLASAWKFLQKRRPEALLFLSITVMFTVPYACWCLWAGDWAWGPRFLLVITPYLILPAGLFFETWISRSRSHRILVAMLIIFSIAIQTIGVTIHPFSFIQSRLGVVQQLTVELFSLTYVSTYCEQAFVNFSPMFSHITGNWWLLKHMIFSYDIWSDVPWRVLGDFNLTTPMWVKGNRTIPFWWPVAFALRSPASRTWVYSLAAANFLVVFWWGLRVKRLFHDDIEKRGREKGIKATHFTNPATY